MQSLAATDDAVAYVSNARLHIKVGGNPWSVQDAPVAENAVVVLDGAKPSLINGIAAISMNGAVARGTKEGLTENNRPLYPHQGVRSWAPRDVRAVAYDSLGNLSLRDPAGRGRARRLRLETLHHR